MKNLRFSFLLAMLLPLFGLTVGAETVNFVGQTAAPTPATGTLAATKWAFDATNGVKFGSDGQYVSWVVPTKTVTAISFDGWINTTNTSKNWGFCTTTDGGTTWSAEKTLPNSGIKSINTFTIPSADIPAGCNGFKVIRRAGTSTYLSSITFTYAGGGGTTTYSITYDNNGHGTAPAAVASATALPNPLPTMTESGWTFDGWYTDATLQTAAVAGAALTANVTLYAKWTQNVTPGPDPQPTTYSITYVNNGHGTTPAVVTSATALPNPLPTMTESGWTFDGWYTDATLQTAAVAGATLTANVTLYAKWTQNVTPQPDPSPVPQTTLTLHQPELYNAPTDEGGYGKDYVTLNGSDYEVYYINRDATNSKLNLSTSNVDKAGCISNGTDDKTFTTNDGWLTASTNGRGGDTGFAPQDEFLQSVHCAKFQNDKEMTMHVKGYSEFALVAKDNNADASKQRYFEVYVDDVKQSMTLNSQAYTIRRFPISTGEHVIKVTATGTSDGKMVAFSLKVADLPHLKYLSGNDSNQVVHQTQALKPIKYTLRRGVGATIALDCPAAGLMDSVSGDSIVTVYGTITAPVGQYTYKVYGIRNGDTSTVVTGHFSVDTYVYRSYGMDTITVNVNEPMRNVIYNYYATVDADAQITWPNGAPAGVNVAKDADNNTLGIQGTPTQVGAYPFTVSVVGGNSIYGLLTVEVPAPLFVAPANANTKTKATQAMTPIVFAIRYATAASVTGLPTGVTGVFGQDSVFTISGTPAAETSYPRVYTYTITPTGLAAYTGAVKPYTGTITVIDPQAKSILYLDNGRGQDKVVDILDNYAVTTRAAEKTAQPFSVYKNFDAIIIGESAEANSPEVLSLIKTINKPIMNMEAFTYQPNRLDWGVANNGSSQCTTIRVMEPTHPVFKGLKMTNDSLVVLSSVNGRGIMTVDVTLQNSYALAVADEIDPDAGVGVAIHEVPAQTRGAGMNTRYVLLALSDRSIANLTADGKKLVVNTLEYVLGNGTATVTVPELKILTCQMGSFTGVINETDSTISVKVPAGTDVKALHTVVTVASSKTVAQMVWNYVTYDLLAGAAIDYSTSYAHPLTFTVSDMINSRDYHVWIEVEAPAALGDVEAEGLTVQNWRVLNPNGVALALYDVQGRLLTMTQGDLDLSGLQHGLYMVVTQSGNSVKVMR